MKSIALLLLTFFISSCATLSQFSVYSVTEADIEQALDAQLMNLQKKASLAGIPLQLAVEDLSVTVGPDGRDVVRLSTRSTAHVGAFGLTYPLKVSLAIEGTPYYDTEDKAIYVRSLSLLDSTIDAGAYKGNIAPISAEFMMLLNGFLSTNPVYKLNDNNKAVALLSTVPLLMSVEQGKLALRPKP